MGRRWAQTRGQTLGAAGTLLPDPTISPLQTTAPTAGRPPGSAAAPRPRRPHNPATAAAMRPAALLLLGLACLVSGAAALTCKDGWTNVDETLRAAMTNSTESVWKQYGGLLDGMPDQFACGKEGPQVDWEGCQQVGGGRNSRAALPGAGGRRVPAVFIVCVRCSPHRGAVPLHTSPPRPACPSRALCLPPRRRSRAARCTGCSST